jgi:hypothetical protein
VKCTWSGSGRLSNIACFMSFLCDSTLLAPSRYMVEIGRALVARGFTGALCGKRESGGLSAARPRLELTASMTGADGVNAAALPTFLNPL